jgi:hypothetical protein
VKKYVSIILPSVKFSSKEKNGFSLKSSALCGKIEKMDLGDV